MRNLSLPETKQASQEAEAQNDPSFRSDPEPEDTAKRHEEDFVVKETMK